MYYKTIVFFIKPSAKSKQICCFQRSSRGGRTRPRGGDHTRGRVVDGMAHGTTGDVGRHQDDDWPFVGIQEGKSHGDYEDPLGSQLRSAQTPKPRIREAFDDCDFAGDIIDELLPT